MNFMKKLTNALRRVSEWYARRKNRTNTTLSLNSDLPRLIVDRSNKHIAAQLVEQWVTIVGMKDFALAKWSKTEKAHELGQIIGKKILDKGISKIVFDRNGYLYHWRVKAFCEWVRAAWVIV